MPVRVSVEKPSLRRLNSALKDIDPNLRRQVGKDIKSAVRPTAQRILSRIPTNAPLSGMVNNGRLAWSKPRVGVYATPGGGKGSIARIEIYASDSKKRAGFKMADRAGTRRQFSGRNRGYVRVTNGRQVTVPPHASRAGQIMTDRLNRYPLSAGGRGGRFGWQNFMKERPFLIRQVLGIINRYVDTVNRKGLR